MRTAEALRAMLDQAHAALKDGEAANAEKRAKAVTAIVRAERDVAEFLAETAATTLEEDEEHLRAELRSRLRRLVDGIRDGAPDDVLRGLRGEGSAP